MESEGGEWNVCVAAPVQRCCAIAVQRSQAKPSQASVADNVGWSGSLVQLVAKLGLKRKKERKRGKKEKEKQAKKSHSLSE